MKQDPFTWINDCLEEFQKNPTPLAIQCLENCGHKCSKRNLFGEGSKQLRALAAHCKTRAEYVKFLTEHIPSVTWKEVPDGIVFYLHKEHCGCPMWPHVTNPMLCHCSCGSNKETWSAFFGKPVEIEIVESFLRGGKDCVFKIII